MPTYEYRCPGCGKEFDLIRSVKAYSPQVTCECGGTAVRHFSVAPAAFGDYEAYNCPITGKRIEGRREHEANLRAHGCRVLEPGETEAFKRRRAAEDEAFESKIAATAEEFVTKLPARDQEALATAIDSGADISLVRQ